MEANGKSAPMKLSEAIRLGSMLISPKPGLGEYIVWHGDEPVGGCILGAIALSAGYLTGDKPLAAFIFEKFPILSLKVESHGYDTLRPLKIVIHIMFEQDRWTTERIAQFVETIEAQEASNGKISQEGREVLRLRERDQNTGASVPQPEVVQDAPSVHEAAR